MSSKRTTPRTRKGITNWAQNFFFHVFHFLGDLCIWKDVIEAFDFLFVSGPPDWKQLLHWRDGLSEGLNASQLGKEVLLLWARPTLGTTSSKKYLGSRQGRNQWPNQADGRRCTQHETGQLLHQDTPSQNHLPHVSCLTGIWNHGRWNIFRQHCNLLCSSNLVSPCQKLPAAETPTWQVFEERHQRQCGRDHWWKGRLNLQNY